MTSAHLAIAAVIDDKPPSITAAMARCGRVLPEETRTKRRDRGADGGEVARGSTPPRVMRRSGCRRRPRTVELRREYPLPRERIARHVVAPSPPFPSSCPLHGGAAIMITDLRVIVRTIGRGVVCEKRTLLLACRDWRQNPSRRLRCRRCLLACRSRRRRSGRG